MRWLRITSAIAQSVLPPIRTLSEPKALVILSLRAFVYKVGFIILSSKVPVSEQKDPITVVALLGLSLLDFAPYMYGFQDVSRCVDACLSLVRVWRGCCCC